MGRRDQAFPVACPGPDADWIRVDGDLRQRCSGLPSRILFHGYWPGPRLRRNQAGRDPRHGYETDKKGQAPQGEIYIRGKPVMTEYYDNPEETAKALTPDGWFKSGDIGEFDKDGHLMVIDRVKNLVKMQGGEYIALEKLEAVYRGTHCVTNVMIHADPEHSRPIAVIMPNEKVLAEEAKKLGVDEHNMYDDKKVNSMVLKDLQNAGRRGGLTGMEIVSGVVITDEEWTPPSGLVTATQKLNRRAIRDTFAKQIEARLKAL